MNRDRGGAAAPGRRLRIVHLCAVDFTLRQFIAPLVRRLMAEGHDVRCACTPGPHWKELKQSGLNLVEMPIARSANPLAALGSVIRLHSFLRRERPDVLHVHTPVASMIGRVAGWLAGVPAIVYTAHGFYFHDRMPPARRRLHVALEWILGRLTDRLFCVSAEDAELAARLGIQRPDRIHHVSNGADPGRFDPQRAGAEARAAIRAELAIPGDATVVAIMGRLVREKGYREFFAAARRLAPRHPGVHFLVIGDTVSSEHDDLKAEILRLARHPRLEGRVHFAGLRDDVPELLAASDVFCLPSYREGMPVSIIEAMMMGLPVVATRIRGCREEVVDGRTGFLVEPRSARELAGALDWLLRHPGRARAMGDEGRVRALALFDEQRILDRQVELYRLILADARR